MAEKRLIDANALLEEIERIYSEHYAQSAYQFIHDFFKAILRRIRRETAVDAVEVVHCGSCRFAEDETADGWLWCGKWNEASSCEGYCHKGERKDNA